MQHRKITFIGAGNMAQAIIHGMVNNGYPANLITACAPSEKNRCQLSQQLKINQTADNIIAVQQADVIVLAVKPQIMAEVCHHFQHLDLSGKLFISIAAGISIARLHQLLGDTLSIVRVMPNTPSVIGFGMSGLFASSQVSIEDRDYCQYLMQSVGKICWVKDEDDINLIIAAAGSAPAYFFLFMEAMQQHTEKLGLDPQTSRNLIEQTALGAAQLVIHKQSLPISTLREQVTSKGGTTAEAIAVFQQHHISDIIAQAMDAAIARAVEMEKNF